MEVVRFGAEDIIATSDILHWETRYKSDGSYNYNVIKTSSGQSVSDYTNQDLYKKCIALMKDNNWTTIGNYNEKGTAGTFYYHDDGWVVYRPGTN